MLPIRLAQRYSLTREMADDYSIAVITNDIYTKEDAEFLCKNSVLPMERIIVPGFCKADAAHPSGSKV